MRTEIPNPYEPPRGEHESPEIVRDRLFGLKKDFLRKAHDRWDILLMLEQGKVNEFLSEVRGAQLFAVASVIIEVFEQLCMRYPDKTLTKELVLRNKARFLAETDLELQRSGSPAWLNLARQIISRNNLNIAIGLSDDEKRILFEDAWNLAMGAL